MIQHREAASIDVGRLIDEGRWSSMAKLFVALTCIAALLDGFDNQVLGFALPVLIKDWHANKSQFAPVLAIGLIGMTIGSGLGGIMGDRFGRKTTIIASMAVFGASTAAVVLIHRVVDLAGLRLIAGIGIGGLFPNSGALAAELTPRTSRSVAVTATVISVPLGGMIGGLVASVILPEFGWRALFALGGTVPIIIAAILWAVMPESPLYLAQRPHRTAELRTLLGSLGFPTSASARFVARVSAGAKRPGVQQLFTVLYRRQTVMLCCAFFFSLFAIYTVFNWAPTLIVGTGAGIGTASRAVAAYNFGGVIGAISFAWVIGRYGSRIPMTAAAAAGAVTAIILAFLTRHSAGGTQLLLWMGLHGLFVNAAETSLVVLAAYVYETDLRATGIGAGLSVGRAGSIIGSFAGASMIAAGPFYYFLALGLALVGVCACISAMPRHMPSGAATR